MKTSQMRCLNMESHLEYQKNERLPFQQIAGYDLSQNGQTVAVKVCHSIYCSNWDDINGSQGQRDKQSPERKPRMPDILCHDRKRNDNNLYC